MPDSPRPHGGLSPVTYAAFAVLRDGTELHPTGWQVRRLALHERLDAPFRLQLSMVTEQLTLELDELAHARLCLEITRGERSRRICGLVLGAEIAGIFAGQLHLRLEVGPALAVLASSRRTRVFEGLTVPEIVAEIVAEPFATFGARLDASRLRQSHIPRDYCVQWDERDLDFVERILADEGITYLLEHEGDVPALVLVDDPRSFGPLHALDPDASESGRPTRLPVLTGAGEPAVEGLAHLAWARRSGPRRWHADAWDWSARPGAVLDATTEEPEGADPWGTGSVAAHAPGRSHEHEGGAPIDRTSAWASGLAAGDRAGSYRVTGRGNAIALRAGATLELVGHPHPDLDLEYLVIEVVHRGDRPQVELGAEAPLRAPDHAVEIVALPLSVPYRPSARTRPVARGPVTAIVVGEGPGEIHTDEHGRVRVRFPWADQAGQPGQTGQPGQLDQTRRSCWLRVAQAWAGAGFGTYFVPRVGMEVVVAFLDGDPDRPLVAGCVYDGANPFPHALPQERTKSGVRTQSCPGGDGYNELCFEDACGRERIDLHAQRDLHEVVRNAQTTRIGADRTLTVAGDRTTTIGHEERLTVKGSRREFIDAHHDTFVKGVYTLSVEGSVHAGGKRGALVTVEHDYVLTAGERLTLRCGKSQIVLTPDGIRIESPSVEVASTEPGRVHCAQLAIGQSGIVLQGDGIGATSEDASLELQAGIELQGEASAGGATLSLQGDARLCAKQGLAWIEGGSVGVTGETLTEISAGLACTIDSVTTTVTGKGTLSLCSDAQTCIDGTAAVVVRGGMIHLN